METTASTTHAASTEAEFFLVGRVLPRDVPVLGSVAAAPGSRRRLRSNWCDVYLVYRNGDVPMEETLDALGTLARAAAVRYWSAGRCDLSQIETLARLPGGCVVATGHPLNSLACRGIEWDRRPGLHDRGVPVLVHSEVEHLLLSADPKIHDFARDNGMIPSRAALAWLLANDDDELNPRLRQRRDDQATDRLERPLSNTHLSELKSLFPATLAL